MASKKEIIDFGFIAFDSEQIDEIVNHIGLHFNNKGYLVKDKNTIKCDCCSHTIKRKNLGNILPGSNIVYCDNPVCFAEYMDKYLNL